MRKTGIRIIAVLLVLLAGILAVAGNYLTNFAITHKENLNMSVAPDSIVKAEDQAVMENNMAGIRGRKETWLAEAEMEPAELISRDGLKLKADVVWTDRNSHRWVLTVHGYTGRRTDMQNIAAFYGEKGYNALMPDMRAHGESEGKYIGMGWPDRLDVLDWISWLLELDPRAEIILHGVSMGGATVMMTAGEELPPQVKGVVEDCGYTSVWDIFSDELDYLFHLPPFPVLYAASAFSKVKAGYSFGEASALEQVKKCRVPMLFIHGSEDNFVHTEMVYKLYDACPSPKDLLVVEGAGHGSSYSMDPEGYFGKVFSFLEEKCF